MKRRVRNKVELRSLTEKVCELQREICEYERFVGDLTLMLYKEEILTKVKYDLPYPADAVWEKIVELIKEKNGNKIQKDASGRRDAQEGARE